MDTYFVLRQCARAWGYCCDKIDKIPYTMELGAHPGQLENEAELKKGQG